jgi:hypothetical protein
MAYAPPSPRSDSGEPDPQRDSGDDAPSTTAQAEHPRLIEEHHVTGRYGQDEIEATDERGRRWYHIRPEPRRRADFIGFNYTWWIVAWIFFMVILFLPWGRGWGY